LAALFLALTVGTYVIWGQQATPADDVMITDGQVSELNWLQDERYQKRDFCPEHIALSSEKRRSV
jgi:hypothetical protein